MLQIAARTAFEGLRLERVRTPNLLFSSAQLHSPESACVQDLGSHGQEDAAQNLQDTMMDAETKQSLDSQEACACMLLAT